jgi:replicative DNA helicase
MSKEDVWKRLIAAHASVNLRAMIANRDKLAFEACARAKAELDERGIWIQDRSGISPREISGEAKGLVSRCPNLGLLVVDHLGLVSSSDSGQASRQNEATRLGDITRAFKNLAGDTKVPCLVLCQLNREVEHRQGGKPQLSDLRDSGRIEEDADIVMFIHRPTTGPNANSNEATLIIAKHRNGPTGEIPLGWEPEVARYHEVERSTDGPMQGGFDYEDMI